MKKSVVSALMVCSITLTALTAAPINVSADEYDTKIEQQDQKITDLQSQEAALQQQLTELQTEIATIKKQGQELSDKQVQLSKEIAELQTEIDDLTVRIEKRDATIQQQARDVQVKGSAVSYMDIILKADSVSDAITRAHAVTKIVNANNDLLKQQESDKQAVQAKKTDADQKSVELQKTAAELDSKAGSLEDKQLQQTIVKNDLAAQRATEEDKKNEFIQQKQEAEAKRAEEARIAAEIEAKRAAEEEANRQAAAAAAQQAAQAATQSVAAPTTESNSSTSSSTNTSSATSSTSTNSGSSESSSSTPAPAPVAPVVPPAQSSNGSGIVADALKELGKPYVWGATGPSSFDCSGLVQYVFAKNGVNLKRVTTQQEYQGTMVSLDQLQPGDLVFFGARGATHHVGIYIGNGQYVHAPQTGDVVKITTISGYRPSFGVRV